MLGKVSDAQLALMDAMVFFVVAMAATDVLLQTIPQADDDEAGEWFDAHRTLLTLLRCSLGSDIEIQVSGGELVIPRGTEVAECLVLEAHCIAFGDERGGFAPMEERLSEIMNALCGNRMSIRLEVFEVLGGRQEALFSIPSPLMESGLVYASSLMLTDADGKIFLVQLSSVPASLAESL